MRARLGAPGEPLGILGVSDFSMLITRRCVYVYAICSDIRISSVRSLVARCFFSDHSAFVPRRLVPTCETGQALWAHGCRGRGRSLVRMPRVMI